MTSKKVFLDANVWFSASHSPSGGSFLLMEFAKEGLLYVYANDHVLDEAERNLLLKSPESIEVFYNLVEKVSPSILPAFITSDVSRKLDGVLPESDVPVIAGAISSGADYLVTLDKKHIANEKMRNFGLPFKIMLPGEFLVLFREERRKT